MRKYKVDFARPHGIVEFFLVMMIRPFHTVLNKNSLNGVDEAAL